MGKLSHSSLDFTLAHPFNMDHLYRRPHVLMMLVCKVRLSVQWTRFDIRGVGTLHRMDKYPRRCTVGPYDRHGERIPSKMLSARGCCHAERFFWCGPKHINWGYDSEQ